MSGWRDATAAAIEAQAVVLEQAVTSLDEAHEVLERIGHANAAHEVRVTTARLRSELGDLAQHAAELRNPATIDLREESHDRRPVREAGAATSEPARR